MAETSKRNEIEATLGLGRARRRRFGPWLTALVVLGLGVGVFAWWQGQGSGDGPVYRTEAARRGDITVTVTATGTVEPTNVVDISSELSGRLKAVNVDYNDRVTRGQVLAELDTEKLEAQVRVQEAGLQAADARVQSATATLGEAMDGYQTARTLDARGVGSHQALTTAKAALDRALAQLQVANADRALADASLALSRAELEKACICSPIDGVVLDRQADAGQIVAASLSAPVLFTVAEDLTKMEVQVAVDEADIGRLAPGNAARFTVEAYDERVFEARIVRIRYAPETVEGVVTYSATLALENADLALRPGMTATAEIIVAEEPDRLLVPSAALRFAPVTETDGGGGSGLLGMIMPRPRSGQAERTADRSVWVLRGGVAEEVAVETGATNGRQTVILGGALVEGERVITGQER